MYLNGTQDLHHLVHAGVPYLVVMATRRRRRWRTYTECFVDMSQAGRRQGRPAARSCGLRMDSAAADVYLDNVELREESDLFGTEGNGFKRGVTDFDLERFELVGA